MLKTFTFVLCLFTLFITVTWTSNWYVDRSASGSNTGEEWDDAWEDLDEIQWGAIDPGDTIYISGGSSSKTYTGYFFIDDVHGTSSAPIKIKVGQVAGHNGQVIITNTDEECYAGIAFHDSTYITIDGNVGGNQNLCVLNCEISGIQIVDGDSHHIKLMYLEIGNNGDESNEHGLHLKYNGETYPIVEASYCKIHDNWSSQIQAFSGGHIASKFGGIIIHDNEIYNITSDGFESGAGGVDFYNNKMHTKSAGGAEGHTDGLQFYGEYYRIYNNQFYNFIHPTESSTAYINIGTRVALDAQVSKEIYVYNNLLYEKEVSPITNSLRGITYVPVKDQTSKISNVIIANNTIVGMPTHGISGHFGRLPSVKMENVIVVNNIIHNCYTNGGGQAINLTHEEPEAFFSKALTTTSDKNKSNSFSTFIAMILSGGLVSCSNPTSYSYSNSVLIDNNIISAGSDGSELIGFCGDIMTHNEVVNEYGINSHGKNVELGSILTTHGEYEFFPDSASDNHTCIDEGMDLSEFFEDALNYPEVDIRPLGKEWDIGAYEVE